MTFLKRNKGKVVLAGLLALLVFLLSSERIVFKLLPETIDSAHYQLSKTMRRSGYLAYWSMDEVVLREPCQQNVPVTRGTRRVLGVRGHARAFLPDEHGVIETGLALPTLSSNFTFACQLRFQAQPKDQNIFQYLHVENGALVSRVPGQVEALRWPITVINRFFHTALVVNGDEGTVEMFINGDAVGASPLGVVAHRGDALLFGQGHWQPPASFTLDECTIWARPLRTEEIATVGRSTRAPGNLAIMTKRFGLAGVEALSDATHSLLLTASMIDPRLGLRRIAGSELPLYDLAMSRADIKYFTAFHNSRVSNGLTGGEGSDARGVGVDIDGGVHPARMTLLPPRRNMPRGTAKSSFTLAVDAVAEGAPRQTMLFRPLEESAFLLPVLAGELAQRCALPVNAPRLCAVFINATPRGLYLCQPLSGAQGGTWLGDDDDGWRRVLARLPLMHREAREALDAIVARHRWALYSDRQSPFTSHEMAHVIRKQRRMLHEAIGRLPARSDQALVRKVNACLTPQMLLNGNPFAEGILSDLDLAPKNVNGATLTFRSLTPAVLASNGRISPQAEASPVQVGVTIRSGAVSATNVLNFVVMARQRALPLIELNLMGRAGVAPAPCEVRLFEVDHNRVSVRESTLRLRGNTSMRKTRKSYYHLAFEERHGIAGLSRSRRLFLTSAYRDPSLIRETLSYDLFRSFSRPGQPRYAPHVRLVEVVLNGDYRGVYEMTDRVDENLLGFADAYWDADHPAVLYKAMGSHATFCYSSASAYVQKVPSWKAGEFWGPYETFASLIANPDDASFAATIETYVDVDNIIDFEILLNLTANWEGRDWNVYIARRGGPNQRFFLVPWDYDVTFHQPGGVLKNCLTRRLHKDLPGYTDRLRDRWWALRAGPLAIDALQGRIDALEAQLASGAAERNFKRWPLLPGDTHAMHVAQLRDWIKARLASLDDYYGVDAAP